MIQVIELKAREGYYLTQVAEVGTKRMYITAIKGVNVKAEDWREATEEEKIAFKNAQKEKFNNKDIGTNGNNMGEMVEE